MQYNGMPHIDESVPVTDCLKLENQLCFPLWACAKGIVARYKPYLDSINLTYTQYISMMVLWEKKRVNVKKLGEALFLDSGTLTPLLKKLEAEPGRHPDRRRGAPQGARRAYSRRNGCRPLYFGR